LGEWLGKFVAMKTLNKDKENLNSFVEEVSLARKLNSPRYYFKLIFIFMYLFVISVYYYEIYSIIIIFKIIYYLFII